MRAAWMILFLLVAGAVAAADAPAHCDTMDGPVIQAAQKALDAGDVTLVLVWVQKRDEGAIREAFSRTVEVRKLSTASKKLADTYFFETLVRIHRAGEGEPYRGIKPAGTDPGAAVRAAEHSLAEGKPQPAAELLDRTMHRGLQKRLDAAMQYRNYRAGDVEAGRKYVEAYVQYLHYVERLYEDARGQPAHGTSPEEHHH